MNSSINASKTAAGPDDAVLVREAGAPFLPPPALDPIAQWISLTEAVQALCPAWLVRTKPTLGNNWRL
jgi:2-methylisocitrate lyase-like PEP mutase family enzyme